MKTPLLDGVKIASKIKLGPLAVDSGTLWVGDPCYIMGGNHSAGKDWNDVVRKLSDSNVTRWDFKNGVKGMGLALATGGDGAYEVEGDVKDGILTSLHITGLSSKAPDKVKLVKESCLLDGIKYAASKLTWGLGGIGTGVFGIPWFKKKYMGIHPETLQLLEQGTPRLQPPVTPTRFSRLVQTQ